MRIAGPEKHGRPAALTPMTEPNEPAPDTQLPDDIDKGLELAYGAGSESIPSASVLARIAGVTGSTPRIALRDVDSSPMLKPLAPDQRREAGKYVIHGELGRGGVGQVHRAHDQDLGRDVAMKFLHEKYKDEPAVLHRFVEEAQIGGQLQHPGIVPVYDLGIVDGRPFFAMKLVKGVTLARKLSERESPNSDRRAFLSIFEDVCQTMAYAHARGVVHRDLKPANVMIGAFGEVQVVDWGMGKVLASGGVADERRAAERRSVLSVIETVRSQGHGSQSVMGSVMGTPAYMPPEQARGDVAAMDERSDVFALGAILCEILTGEPPYVGEPKDVIVMAALGKLDDANARLAACGADAAIVELASQCLVPAPAARPASAAAVAERVAAYLSSVEDRARQAELRATEARYRHRMTLLAAAGALLLVVLGTCAWLWLEANARARRDQVMARVSTARTAASGALGQAEASGQDEQRWAAALAGAEQVVTLCADEAVDTAVRAEATATLAQVQQKQHAAAAEAQRLARDAAMQKRLELVRIPTDDDLRSLAAQTRELRRLDAAYAEAFATYLGSTSMFDGPPDAVLASLQRGDIEADLATSLDHWGLVRDALRNESDPPDPARTARIRTLAMQLDAANMWRVQLRSLLPDAANEGARLLALTAQADFATLSATGCRVLAEALWRANEKDAAVIVLQRGQQLHPQDFDLCFALATSLAQLPEPKYEEAVATWRIAYALRPEQAEVLHRQGIALEALGRVAQSELLFRLLITRDPKSAHWHFHVGYALAEQGKLDEAIVSYHRAIEIDPKDAHSYNNLGEVLWTQGRPDEAIASWRRAIELDPEFALAHVGLGNALQHQGKLDEAVASFRRAIEIDPKHATAYTNLGITLKDQGKLDEAIASFRRAIAIDPNSALPHNGLGIALTLQGKLDEAVASYGRAIELDPKDALTRANVSALLRSQGKLDEAIASCRRAIEIAPKYANAYNNLGLALQDQGKLDEAIASFRRAIELDPESAHAHFNLSNALRVQGELDEAIAGYRTALRIWAARKDAFSVEWSARAQEQIDLLSDQSDQRPAVLQVLRRERAPASSDEFAAAATLGYQQQRFQDVVAMTEATLAKAPELVGGDWGAYNPACAAALLASGKEPALATEERARLRGLARTWLLREVANWRAQLGSADAAAAAAARQKLAHALEDTDFASVRGASIDSLPEAERQPWRKVWSAIEDALQTKAR